jgi:hypothetical protein
MKKSKLVRMSLLAGCLSACGQPELPAEPDDYAGVEPMELLEVREERAPAEAPPPLRPMNAWEGVEELEAATGQRYVVTQGPTGLTRVPYVEKNGMAVVGGDVVLGSVEELRQARERGIAVTETWFPNGRLPWFNEDLSGTGLTTVRKAAQLLESRTPVRVDEVTEGSERAIRMKMVDPLSNVTLSGGNTPDYWQPGENTPKIVYSRADPSLSTVLHELGHAMGFPHEFQRPDRNTYVDSVNGCSNSYDYARLDSVWWSGTASRNLGPFDFETIMKHGYETCVVLQSGYNWATPRFQSQPMPLSRRDINSIYRVYAGKLAANEGNDGFGLAVSTGDYDADGQEDIVVGFRDLIPSGEEMGKFHMWLYFFRGVETDPAEGYVDRRFMPWFTRDLGVTTESGNDTLTLASGDFNGDGIKDVAVGLPWYNAGQGLVKVLFLNTGLSDSTKSSYEREWAPWGRKGVLYEHNITPAFVGLNAMGKHRFGAALATGKITSKRTLHAVLFDDLIIGAPKATNSAMPPFNKNGGAVALVRGTYDSTPYNWTPTLVSLTWSPNNVSTTEFGAALTVLPQYCENEDPTNEFNNADTFVVGAPGYNSSAGAVYVYGCALDPTGTTTFAPALVKMISHSQAGARYGHAVAGFRTEVGWGRPEEINHYLVTGAPGYTGSDGLDSGIIYLDHLELDGTKTYVNSIRPGTRYGQDEFGYSLAVMQRWYMGSGVGGSTDAFIAIGMPGTQVDGVRAGKVYIWRPWNADGSNNTVSHVVSAATPSSVTSTRFGETLATLYNFDSSFNVSGFVAGAPLSRELDDPLSNSYITAGSIEVILNESTVIDGFHWDTWRKHLNQEATGDKRPDNL